MKQAGPAMRNDRSAPASGSPSPWVARFAHLAGPGRPVLDLAAGRGRHSLYFADFGHPVTAIDRNPEALSEIAALQDGPISAVELLAQDLEAPGFDLLAFLEHRSFGAVVVTNYLHRPLLPALPRLLEPGGVLIYETFGLGNAAFGRPSNPDFLLRPDELPAAFPDLETVAFEQGIISRATKAVVQRICCRRTDEAPAHAPLRAR